MQNKKMYLQNKTGQNMSTIGQREIFTQRRVIAFFRDALGYAYLGHWKDRPNNSNVEKDLLTGWLKRQGYSGRLVSKTLDVLDKAVALTGSKTLYDANSEVYGLLRYGVKIKPGVGEMTKTVRLIDWDHTENNDFAIAEAWSVVNKLLGAFGVLITKKRAIKQGMMQQHLTVLVRLVLPGHTVEGKA